MIKGKPFVKWAGGKRQIIDKLKKYVPDELDRKSTRLNSSHPTTSRMPSSA